MTKDKGWRTLDFRLVAAISARSVIAPYHAVGADHQAARRWCATLTGGPAYPHEGFGLPSPAKQQTCNGVPTRVRQVFSSSR